MVEEQRLPKALSEWRAAVRDVAAAETAKEVARRTLSITQAAEDAAKEAEEAANRAAESAALAKIASEKARSAAHHARQLTVTTMATAEGDVARANQQLVTAGRAEAEAAAAFRSAQDDSRSP